MAKPIKNYDVDNVVEPQDKLIGSNASDGQTGNYRISDVLDLLVNTYSDIQLTYKFHNDAVATEADLGIMTSDSDTILTVTALNVNQFNTRSEDMTEFLGSLDTILPTYDVFLNIKDTVDGTIFGYFKITSIVDNTGNFTINGAIEGAIADNDFINENYYFLGDIIWKIQTSQPSAVPQKTWAQLVSFSPRNNGDRFEITDAVGAPYGRTYSFITLIGSDSFFYDNGVDIETIIIA